MRIVSYTHSYARHWTAVVDDCGVQFVVTDSELPWVGDQLRHIVCVACLRWCQHCDTVLAHTFGQPIEGK